MEKSAILNVASFPQEIKSMSFFGHNWFHDFFWHFFVNFEAVIVLKSKQSNCHSLLQFRTIGTKKKIHIVS